MSGNICKGGGIASSACNRRGKFQIALAKDGEIYTVVPANLRRRRMSSYASSINKRGNVKKYFQRRKELMSSSSCKGGRRVKLYWSAKEVESSACK